MSAFVVYAAVLTERYSQHAPGLFKRVSDIEEMERPFGGTAWKSYDESFRREKNPTSWNLARSTEICASAASSKLRIQLANPFVVQTPAAQSAGGGVTHEGHVSRKGNATVLNKFLQQPHLSLQACVCPMFG